MSPVTQGPVAPTRALARLAAAAVPDGARVRATAAVTAVTTAAAAGASHPELAPLSEVAAELATPPEAPVPGTAERYAAAWSAYLTGTAAGLADVRPAVRGTGAAPTASSGPAAYATVVVPAALAVAAEQGLRMEAVAEAVAVGLEVGRRVEAALGGGLGAFDRIATIGRLAAVAAAARLLRLPEDAAVEAYGIAGTQAAGFGAVAADPAGALQVGKAASDAVEAAYLARDGYTAGPAGIEGRRGFAALLAPSADVTALDVDPAVPDIAGPPDADADLARTAEDFIASFGG